MEEWRSVVGYEGIYEVSSEGRIKSINYYGKCGERIRSCSIRSDGYVSIHLNKDGKGKTKLVHRIVAEAFLPNPNNLEMINHKNEDRSDNRVENLEWCSRSYNQLYSIKLHEERKMLFAKNFKGRNGKAVSSFTIKGIPHTHKRKVIQKDKEGNVIKIFNNPSEASAETNIDSGKIIGACNRNTRENPIRKRAKSTAKGYIWEYAEN